MFRAYLDWLTEAQVRSARSGVYFSDADAYYWGAQIVALLPLAHGLTIGIAIDSLLTVIHVPSHPLLRLALFAPFLYAALSISLDTGRARLVEDRIRCETPDVQAHRAHQFRRHFVTSIGMLLLSIFMYAITK